MPENNLKDFTINWVIGGILMFCLLTFTITFIYDNESLGLDDGTGNVLGQKYNNISNRLIGLPETSNYMLNITANTNPEVSDLGSRDSVSVSYEAKKSVTDNWEDYKELISWVFSGTSGKVILGSVGGMIGILSMFYIWRFIRGG